jgi:hypothetical protein
MVGEFGGEALDDAVDGGLLQVVVEADLRAVVSVETRCAVVDLHHESDAVRSSSGMARGVRDQVGVHAHAEHPESSGEIVFLQRLVPLRRSDRRRRCR